MTQRLVQIILAIKIFFEQRSDWFRWLLVAVWYSVIFVLSAIPATRGVSTREMVGGDDHLNTMVRFLAHVLVFSILALFIYLAYNRNFTYNRKRIFLATCINALCGFSDEAHQYFVPGRYFRLQDVVTDTFGGLIVLWAVLRFLHYLKARTEALK